MRMSSQSFKGSNEGFCHFGILPSWRFCAARRVFVQDRVLVQSHIFRHVARTLLLDRFCASGGKFCEPADSPEFFYSRPDAQR
jgi:hypothetical protein